MSEPKDPRYEIDMPEMQRLLKDLGAKINSLMPDGWGFTLFLFQFKDEACFYLSSANRGDMIKVLREFIKREEAQ